MIKNSLKINKPKLKYDIYKQTFRKKILPTGKLAQNVTVKYKTINKIYELN